MKKKHWDENGEDDGVIQNQARGLYFQLNKVHGSN
jgi:hypothetical protein